MSKSKILLQVCGSIAAYKACELISTLVKNNFEVKVVASKSALHFVGGATFEGLSGHPVYSDLWEQGRMMDHISLNRWADLILVAPATASYINRAAAGTGDDLLMTLFLAHDFKKPFWIAPAMNQAMFDHPVTQNSIQSLKKMGIKVLESPAGDLACGEVGPGRLMEPEDIFQQLQQVLARPAAVRTKILITAGGTSENIDDVRVLTNKSTGNTGACIADRLIEDGFDVTFLAATSSEKPKNQCRQLSFSDFHDLELKLKQELSESYAAVIHAAAVSDYSPTPHPGKLSSDKDIWNLELKKNPKLVNQLKTWSANKDVKLIAFKLTSNFSEDQQKTSAEKLLQDSKADLVVQNDFQQFKGQEQSHRFNAFTDKQNIFNGKNRQELAHKISEYLREKNL